MGCMVHVGILTDDKKLTEKAKQKFINEVKDILKYGTDAIPEKTKPKFECGGSLPPDPFSAEALKDLEDEKKFPDFHKNVLGTYEKIANSLDSEGNFSILPIADPIALAGKFQTELPALSFPDGYAPYFTGLLVPKMAADLVKSGKSEFILPVKLAAKLPNLASVPQPPAFEIPPKLPLPPSVTISASSPTPCLEKVPPVIPQNALSTLATINQAAAEGIPKLIAQVIAKMPGIVAKLPNITDAVAEICGLVRDSGIFGEIKDSSTTQKAATIVLSRKTSECILINAMANTVGSSPGSATSAVAVKISGNGPEQNSYGPLEKPPVTIPVGKPAPVQRALQRARELDGASWGTQTYNYTTGLFYIEDLLSRPEKDVTIHGLTPTTDDGIGLDVRADESIITLTTMTYDQQNKYKVEFPQGFYNYAEALAKDSSSCGLFVRACYAAGGCINSFFLSKYPQSLAITGLQHISRLRNYRWIKDQNGKPGIVDAINQGYFYISSDGSATLDPEKSMDNGNTKINLTVNDILNIKVSTHDGNQEELSSNNVDNFQLHVVAKGGKYVVEPLEPEKTTGGKALRAFLKPFQERATIGELELSAIELGQHPDYRGAFPPLDAGDTILVRNTKNVEHVLLVSRDRLSGFDIGNKEGAKLFKGSTGNLSEPIYGIEGGQVDDKNLADIKEIIDKQKIPTKESVNEQLKAVQGLGNQTKFLGTLSYQGDKIFRLTKVDAPVPYSDGTNWLWVEETQLHMGGKPTAIRSAAYTLGTIQDHAFWVGKQSITTATGQVFPDGTTRRIFEIFKGKNILNPAENGEITSDMSDEYKKYIESGDPYTAAKIMDFTNGLKSVSTLTAGGVYLDQLENRVFPTLSGIDGGRKHNKAAQELKNSKQQQTEK
jgi:hypothetical protein